MRVLTHKSTPLYIYFRANGMLNGVPGHGFFSVQNLNQTWSVRKVYWFSFLFPEESWFSLPLHEASSNPCHRWNDAFYRHLRNGTHTFCSFFDSLLYVKYVLCYLFFFQIFKLLSVWKVPWYDVQAKQRMQNLWGNDWPIWGKSIHCSFMWVPTTTKRQSFWAESGVLTVPAASLFYHIKALFSMGIFTYYLHHITCG